jgi:aspartyl/asparaginyl beta-hydroxylase (cupin superfamily)
VPLILLTSLYSRSVDMSYAIPIPKRSSRSIIFLGSLLSVASAWLLPSSTSIVRRQSLFLQALTDFQSFTDSILPSHALNQSLAPHTFAGMVETAIQTKFQDQNVSRVIASWRLLDRDYEHKQWFAGISNKRYLQYCHSYVPGLTVQPFWDTSAFAWCGQLQKQYASIRQEFLQATSDMTSLQDRGNNIWAGATTANAAEYGESWRTLVLMDRGQWDSINCQLFPVTTRAIRDCGVDAVEVFFARMQPHTKISEHSDFTNFVLTSHLPLVVPYSGTNQCRLTVGDTTREWLDGQLMLFDTSLIHDALNDSDQARYILMIRLWHPDLSDAEKQALQFTFDCLQIPGLISSDPDERRLAEEEAISWREFPKLESAKAVPTGFGTRNAKTVKRKGHR